MRQSTIMWALRGDRVRGAAWANTGNTRGESLSLYEERRDIGKWKYFNEYSWKVTPCIGPHSVIKTFQKFPNLKEQLKFWRVGDPLYPQPYAHPLIGDDRPQCVQSSPTYGSWVNNTNQDYLGLDGLALIGLFGQLKVSYWSKSTLTTPNPGVGRSLVYIMAKHDIKDRL